MNWEAVSAISEVAGLMAIVASLAYIGIQTKQTNDHATASAEVAYSKALNQIFDSWVVDERTITTLQNGFRSFNNLSKSDKAIFQMRIGTFVNHWLLAQELSEKNLLAKEISDEMSKIVVAVLSTSGGLQYWEYDSKATPRGEELLKIVKESMGQQPTFTELMPWWAADDPK